MPFRAQKTNPKTSRVASAADAVVETLEGRQMLSVSVDSAGFTQVTPPAGARVVYVSSSHGSDGNTGLSPSSPVKSLNKGKSLLHSGAGDQLLLAAGDTWHESFGYWGISGKDSSNPVVIGSYGSGARPTVASGSATAWTNGLVNVHDVAFIGVHLDGSGRGGAVPDGISSSGRLNNLLVENCDIEQYRNNIIVQGFFTPISNVTLRRNIIADSYSHSSHSQGLFADNVHGVKLDQNVFDHNGWGHGAGATMFNHNAYITAHCDGLVATGNIFANASSHGLQARPGGTITNNLFYNDAIGLSFGLVNGGGDVKPGGVTGTVANNVFIGGHGINGAAAGVGVEVSNISSAAITGNVFAYGDPSSRNAAINLTPIKGTANPGQAVGINNLTIANNIVYKWSQGMQISGGVSIHNVNITNNDFQAITAFQAVTNANSGAQLNFSSNTYTVPHNPRTALLGVSAAGLSMTSVSFPNGKDVGGYDAAVGGSGTAADFLARARSLSDSNWDSKYFASSVVSWVKSAFGSGNSTPTIPVISVPTVTPAAKLGTSTSTTGAKKTPVRGTPSLTIGDASGKEGASGTKTFTFKVTLSQASAQKVTVKWATNGQTAKVGSDYVGGNGTLTFKPGETTKTISVKVKGDRSREATEKFIVNLTSAAGASIADGQGVGTILNDD